jgi:hypothetical protein
MSQELDALGLRQGRFSTRRSEPIVISLQQQEMQPDWRLRANAVG